MEAAMAYCNNCGAYIPDGQKKCLACGFDAEDAEREEASAARAKQAEATQTDPKDSEKRYSFNNEELRQKLEKQRKKQQEQSRIWAEQEKQRREKQRENAERKSYTGTSSREYSSSRLNNFSNKGSSTKLLSIISYFSALFLVPMIFKPEDSTANYHAKQGLRLFIYGLICDAVTWTPFIGAIVQLSRIFFLIKGVINAANGKQEPLPLIGTLGEKK
jgi:uncharacterized membrane protein